ncbi:enoyl-CoA hydratase/isomerase family protein [Caulobacter sp. CCUG 60055]|uniref:enoyl-CoA hydratase/isomerase family protein n=1 Tax=Caulobacter sp. CCUG 60055 TaxID=2100090 RepID=UPI001FA71B5B
MSDHTLHLSRPAAHVARIEIDAPPMNALGRGLRERFLETLDALEADLDVRALIVTGRGRAFCAGDDLKEARGRGEGAAEGVAHFARLHDRLEAFRAPTVAAVNGHCVGGGLELALCCDVRLAAREASFTCAGVNVGLMASAWRLPRLIGVARAKAMLLTGSPCDAAAAERAGLTASTHAGEALAQAALDLAVRIAGRAPLSVEATKRVAGRALDLDADAARAAAEREIEALVRTADHAEALAAFAERRDPVFHRR